jgi:cyanophycinase-like exopeptidase
MNQKKDQVVRTLKKGELAYIGKNKELAALIETEKRAKEVKIVAIRAREEAAKADHARKEPAKATG